MNTIKRFLAAIMIGLVGLTVVAPTAEAKNPFKKIERGIRHLGRQIDKHVLQPPKNAVKEAIDDAFPMHNYCVTFSEALWDGDIEGARSVRSETIHVRGGRDMARGIAAARYGGSNVKDVKKGACSSHVT